MRLDLEPCLVRDFAHDYEVTIFIDTELTKHKHHKVEGPWSYGSQGGGCNLETREVVVAGSQDYKGKDAAHVFHEVVHVICGPFEPEELYLLQFEDEAAKHYDLDPKLVERYRRLTPIQAEGGKYWHTLRSDPYKSEWWAAGFKRAEELGLLPLRG